MDIAELFARDPLQLSQLDLEHIIEEFRKARNNFSLGNPKAGSTKPPTEKQKQVISLADKLKISI